MQSEQVITHHTQKVINLPTPEGWSDYKSASSVERIEAFIRLGRPDPVIYADETGLVDYEVAKSHVKQILENYEG